MKIVFGAVFILAALLIVGLGRRKGVALVIGALTLALGAWWLYGGIVATGRREAAAAFIAAAERGDLATVRKMADDNPVFVNASESHDDDSTVKWPITVAAKELHADVVEFLLSRGAIVNAETDNGSTPLHEAGEKHAYSDDTISAKRVATIKALLAHGASVDAKNALDRTPLMINAHDAKAVALLIDHHANVKAHDSWGLTPLHYAVGSHSDHSDAIALLLAHGADVNAHDRDGDTPFLLAGNARDIETLVAHGADTKVRDKNGQTALHRAARSPMNLFSDLDVLAELCACGLRPDARDHAGATPLSLARDGLAGETDKGWMQGRRRIVAFLSPGGPCTKLAGATKEQRDFVVAGIRCAEEDPYGCSALAWDYDTGKGTVTDKSRAAQLYDTACRLGSQSSCTNLAYDYDQGEGVDEDPQRAVALYEKPCDAGEARACYNLGLMVSAGRGTAQDPARAAALFRKACDGGDSNACDHIAGK
jgi:ankyrin repeat protein